MVAALKMEDYFFYNLHFVSMIIHVDVTIIIMIINDTHTYTHTRMWSFTRTS